MKLQCASTPVVEHSVSHVGLRFLCTDVGYIETSALTGMNVEECFFKLARAVIETIDNGARRVRPLCAHSIHRTRFHACILIRVVF